MLRFESTTGTVTIFLFSMDIQIERRGSFELERREWQILRCAVKAIVRPRTSMNTRGLGNSIAEVLAIFADGVTPKM